MSGNDTDIASVELRLRRNGLWEIQASGTLRPSDFPNFASLFGGSSSSQRIINLIEVTYNLPSNFFSDLIKEINLAYTYQLYTSTFVCLRKLFENLIIELLRKKYGIVPPNLDLYYWIEKRRFNDFSILIKNFEEHKVDFLPYTTSFDQRFFEFLKKFKETADKHVHSIDIITIPSKIENDKIEINHCIHLMCDVCEKITSI